MTLWDQLWAFVPEEPGLSKKDRARIRRIMARARETESEIECLAALLRATAC